MFQITIAERKNYTEELPKLKRVDYEAGDVKRQIAGTIKILMKTCRFQSINEYRALLSLYGVPVGSYPNFSVFVIETPEKLDAPIF